MSVESTIDLIIQYIPHIVTFCSAVAAITPMPKAEGILKTIMKIVDVLAINVGHAKDK